MHSDCFTSFAGESDHKKPSQRRSPATDAIGQSFGSNHLNLMKLGALAIVPARLVPYFVSSQSLNCFQVNTSRSPLVDMNALLELMQARAQANEKQYDSSQATGTVHFYWITVQGSHLTSESHGLSLAFSSSRTLCEYQQALRRLHSMCLIRSLCPRMISCAVRLTFCAHLIWASSYVHIEKCLCQFNLIMKLNCPLPFDFVVRRTIHYFDWSVHKRSRSWIIITTLLFFLSLQTEPILETFASGLTAALHQWLDQQSASTAKSQTDSWKPGGPCQCINIRAESSQSVWSKPVLRIQWFTRN